MTDIVITYPCAITGVHHDEGETVKGLDKKTARDLVVMGRAKYAEEDASEADEAEDETADGEPKRRGRKPKVMTTETIGGDA